MVKVSVCIPTYNRCHFLLQAIDSALHQRLSDIEIIVCDDGSTDATPARIAQITDPRVRYVRHDRNIGKSNNMRSGFEVATGTYFIKFDDDDRLTVDFLARTSAILDQHPDVDMVGTDHWLIDAQGRRLVEATEANSQHWKRTTLAAGRIDRLLEVVFADQSLQVGATLFRRQALLDVNFMRPNLQNCEDTDLFVRLALAGKTAYYLPDRLMEYRVHPEQRGLQREIPYLKDKLEYLQSYQFTSPALEHLRTARLAETKLLLGLRLIHVGETLAGRTLIRDGQATAPLKAWVGMGLSYLPPNLREMAFQLKG